MDLSGGMHFRSRRAHRKSRLGCISCKKRRVKCDEKKPTCTNCTNHGIDCAYAVTTPESQSPATPDQDNETHPRPRARRYRPYHYATGGVTQTFKLPKTDDKKPTTQSKETQCDLTKPSSPTTISLPDLELFHHYTVSTSKTMVEDNDNDAHQLWQNHLPQWSLQFPSLLHLLLSLSALHLAAQNPVSRNQYSQQADEHFTFGMRSVTAVLSQLDEENCQKIYMAAVIICFVYFGRGPREGEYLVFSENGPAEWLVLMRGVRLILQSYHSKVFSGILEPKQGGREYILTSEMRSELYEHTVHTEAVSRLIESQITDPDKCAMYQSIITNLREVMYEVYGRCSTGFSGVGLMDVLIGWLYRLPEEMVSLLEEKEPYALIVLSYWAVMLIVMEDAWFMRGWAEHVLLGISASSGLEFRAWVEWPLRRMRAVRCLGS